MRPVHLPLFFACAALALVAHAAGAAAADPLEQLVASSATRLAIAEQVALTKWDGKDRVEDAPREAVVINSAREQGAARNLEQDWVGDFFRAQIEASKELQYSLLATWRRAGAVPVHLPVDLVNNIRPRLDNLQTLFIRQLADAATIRLGASCTTQVAAAVANYAAEHRLDMAGVRVAALDRAMAGFCLTN
ncbi:MAG TPA: chorismate mutase [Janthinobacterium sp.]|jgi:chorismate mutase|nr:chorismate mutase [Janthinobacterium sp.]